MTHYYNPSLGPRLNEKSQASVDVMSWIEFAEASIMLHGIPLFYVIKGGAGTEDGTGQVEKVCARGIKADFQYVEDVLKKNGGNLVKGWEFTVADCAIWYHTYSTLRGTYGGII